MVHNITTNIKKPYWNGNQAWTAGKGGGEVWCPLIGRKI